MPDGEHTSSGYVPAPFLVELSSMGSVFKRTGSSSQAAIKASYGLLKDEVEIPLRSSKVLVEAMATRESLETGSISKSV